METSNHGDRFLNEFNEFIQKPVPMIITDSFLTFQVYLFLPLADADASA